MHERAGAESVQREAAPGGARGPAIAVGTSRRRRRRAFKGCRTPGLPRRRLPQIGRIPSKYTPSYLL